MISLTMRMGEHIYGLTPNYLLGLGKGRSIFAKFYGEILKHENLPAQNQEPGWPIQYPWLSVDWILQEEVQPWTEIMF